MDMISSIGKEMQIVAEERNEAVLKEKLQELESFIDNITITYSEVE